MALRQARLVCPQARLIPADPTRYRHTFDRLLEALAAFSPRVEPGEVLPASVAWLDLGHLRESEMGEMVRSLGRTARQAAGLPPSIGLAGGKFPAGVAAASTEPGRARIVPPNRQAEFLAPFPVGTLPLDAETARRAGDAGYPHARPTGRPACRHRCSPVWGKRILTPPASPGPRRAAGPPPPLIASRKRRAPLRGAAGRPGDPGSCGARTGGGTGRALTAKGLVGRELRLVLEMEDRAVRQESLVLRRPTGDARRLGRVASELLGRLHLTCQVSTLQVTMTAWSRPSEEQLDLFVHQSGQERPAAAPG